VSLLRFLLLLSLTVWLGGVIFFAVLAPTVFRVLPTHHLAGSLIAPLLSTLHWMGLVSGVVFLATSLAEFRIRTGAAHGLAGSHLLVLLMIGLTLVSQFVITPKMNALRSSMGIIDNVRLDDPARIAFNGLHVWSTRLEIGVLLLGLVVIYLTASRLAAA
jgi:hypothetical protein